MNKPTLIKVGFLLSAFGVQNLVLSEAIGVNSKAHWATTNITTIAPII